MILTGKAKEDFDKWLYENTDNIILKEEQEVYWLHKSQEVTLWDVFEKLPTSLHNSLMIDWLDSVGYHICIEPHIGGGADVYYAKVIYRLPNFIDTWEDVENPNIIGEYYFSSRQEATKQAILKANQIYNEKEENR